MVLPRITAVLLMRCFGFYVRVRFGVIDHRITVTGKTHIASSIIGGTEVSVKPD